MSDLSVGVVIGNQSHRKAIGPNVIIFSCLLGIEILRLDIDGMVYKGQRIEDGGEAHRAFLLTMRVLSGGNDDWKTRITEAGNGGPIDEQVQ